MKAIFIKVNSPEWEFIWNWLSNHPLNKDNTNPRECENNGEVWQYMGSFANSLTLLDDCVHEFRHRSHPLTGERRTLSVQASKDMKLEDVERDIKIN